MNVTTVLLLLLLLACPIAMVFMHRGGHAHGSHHGTRQAPEGPVAGPAARGDGASRGDCEPAGHVDEAPHDHPVSGRPA